MQIAQFLRVLIAVLSLAAVFYPAVCQHEQFNNHTLSTSRHNFGMYEWIRTGYVPYDQGIPLEHAGELLSLRDNQQLLKKEAHHENRTSVECCPSVLEMTEPRGGKNRDDQIVELYHDGNITQRFYEVSCHVDILEKPCRFMDKKLHGESRCKQSYMFTYALVKDPVRHRGGHHHQHRGGGDYGHNGSWTLDYIKIRSGCSCVVIPPTTKKTKKRDKFKNKRRHKGYD